MAKLLHVTPRTLHNWIAGRHDIPYAAFKLVRVLLRYELPGDDWHGWHFHAGKLYTPEGRFIEPSDSDWWSLLVRKSQMFVAQYARCVELERAIRAPGAPRLRGVPGAMVASSLASVVGSSNVAKQVRRPAARVPDLPPGNHGDNRRCFASCNEVLS